MPEPFVGIDMTLYRNTGTYGAPVWTLLDNVHDLRITRQKSQASVAVRRTRTKQYEPGALDLGLEWSMVREEADAGYTAVQAAFDAGTIIELAFANGSITVTGTKYTRCEYKLFGFDEDQGDDNGVYVAVTAKPCRSANAPTKVTAP